MRRSKSMRITRSGLEKWFVDKVTGSKAERKDLSPKRGKKLRRVIDELQQLEVIPAILHKPLDRLM
jgi:hypothetical protein